MTREKDKLNNTKRIAYTTSIEPELLKKFKVYCAMKERYHNEVIEELLKDLLDKEGDVNGNYN